MAKTSPIIFQVGVAVSIILTVCAWQPNPPSIHAAPRDALVSTKAYPFSLVAVPVAASQVYPDAVVHTYSNPEPSLFDLLIQPLANEAQRRRAERAKTDPEYSTRVDGELNAGRVNFLLFGYGETHEPPYTEKAIIGSHTILSYDLRTRQADIISLTHDIRAPEIERELTRRGIKKIQAVRMDQAYSVGGFKLMRLVLEDATGLAVDFQITFRDALIQGLVDAVFGGVTVDVPMEFYVHPFYVDGKKFERGYFPRGMQRLSGRQVIQFIKTVPVWEGVYPKELEHNARKALVFKALLDTLQRKCRDRDFWLKSTAFVTGELVGGSIVYDFDPVVLLVNNIGTTTAMLQQTAAREFSTEMRMPKIRREKYIVDPAHGDGGVQWITANAAVNPITQRDIESGVYPSMDVEVPLHANPYGDLVTEYWTSVRLLVKHALLAPMAVYNFPTD